MSTARFFRGGAAFLLMFAAVFLPFRTQAAQQEMASRTIAGRKYLHAGEVARYFGMRLSYARERYEMRGAAGSVIFNPRKRYGSFNGTVINYDFAPEVVDGALYVSFSDFQNLLQPLLNVRSLRSVPVRTIMIDPGHGGSDCGAIGKCFQEKVLTLLIAWRVKALLEKQG